MSLRKKKKRKKWGKEEKVYVIFFCQVWVVVFIYFLNTKHSRGEGKEEIKSVENEERREGNEVYEKKNRRNKEREMEREKKVVKNEILTDVPQVIYCVITKFFHFHTGFHFVWTFNSRKHK